MAFSVYVRTNAKKLDACGHLPYSTRLKAQNLRQTQANQYQILNLPYVKHEQNKTEALKPKVKHEPHGPQDSHFLKVDVLQRTKWLFRMDAF